MATAALGVAWGLAEPSTSNSGHASEYVVLPFVDRTARGAELTPDEVSMNLRDALGWWADLRLVDALRTHDALARGGALRTLSDALVAARRVGAGRLVWGEYSALPDGVLVEASLYNVADGRPLRRVNVRLARDHVDARARFTELAASLLDAPALPGDVSGGTHSLAAARAFQEGMGALNRWDLERAADALARAAVTDPGFARARLWLGQVRLWRGTTRAEWAGEAERAAADSTTLAPRERALAAGLLALADRRYPEACRRYASLVAHDSADFAAWYGLGECNFADSLVVADLGSPSGLRFRGSWHVAVSAYTAALRTVPSSYLAMREAAFARLGGLLITDARRIRLGYAATPDHAAFAAYPALLGDTIAYTPIPSTALRQSGAIPATRAGALRRNREAWLALVESWVRASPASLDAREAHSRALEVTGALHAASQGRPTALSELEWVRARTTEPDRRLRLAVAQARIWVKMGEFARAAATADSVLRAWPNPGPHDAQRLVPLAALTGKAALARVLLRRSEAEGIPVAGNPAELELALDEMRPYADLLVADAFGLTPEAEAAERRVESAIRVWADPALVEKTRASLLTLPRRMAVERGIRGERRTPLRTGDPVIAAERELAAGNRAAARDTLARQRALRGDRRPGDQTLDNVLAEAQLLLLVGDTATAIAELDRSLAAISALSLDVLDRLPEAVAVPRALELRGALALAQGDDAATARRWSDALTALWASGDPALRRRAERLRSATLQR